MEERRAQQSRWDRETEDNRVGQFLAGIERSNHESVNAGTNRVKFINTTSKNVELIWLVLYWTFESMSGTCQIRLRQSQTYQYQSFRLLLTLGRVEIVSRKDCCY